jgi:predicted nucleotidyltransferase component of viral defense system
MTTQRWQGAEEMTGAEWRMGLGLMLSNPFADFGPNARAFGHPGAGGVAGFVDPDRRLAIGYLPRQGAHRFILKGGMAMRALYGSTRLTKDVDFDGEASLSRQSMQAQMPKALVQAARQAGLNGIDVQQTKAGDRSSRWRIAGRTAEDVATTWEVEVSRRGIPPADFIETRAFETPIGYRIPNFNVRVYGPAAMAGGKVNALLSLNRSVPRDVYDLHELIRNKADPAALWITRVPREFLERKRPEVMSKIDRIDFPLANSELLPYIAPDVRAGIDEARWDEIRLDVAEHVDDWLRRAIERAKPAEELHRDTDDEIDFAGR